MARKMALVLEMENLELSKWPTRIIPDVNLEVSIAVFLEGKFSPYLKHGIYYLLPLRFFILVQVSMSKILHKFRGLWFWKLILISILLM